MDLSLDMRMRTKKGLFQANSKNKQRFINLLGSQMEHMDGITCEALIKRCRL